MKDLTPEEKAVYEWQIWMPGFGEEAQRKLKASTALVSRVGGLGGPLAQQLVAAGIGRLILVHGGNLKPSDLNRQILMTHDWIGKPRAEIAAKRLRELNPRTEITAVPENFTEENAARLVGMADIVFDCAPLFEERFLMNRECVRQKKPLVDCAMYGMEGQVMVIRPGKTACLACLYPEVPKSWKRQFPVIGAVSATAGAIGAMEGIKILTGLGKPLEGEMLYYDLKDVSFQKIPVARRPDCAVCCGV